MPGKPDDFGKSLYKGDILRKVDKLLNEKDGHGNFIRRPSFLAMLEGIDLDGDRDDNDIADEYIAVLQDEGFSVDGVLLVDPNVEREERFLRDWFRRGDFGVPSVVRELIEGTIEVIKRARHVNLPIDSYLLEGVGNQFKIRGYISDYQVTRVIYTP